MSTEYSLGASQHVVQLLIHPCALDNNTLQAHSIQGRAKLLFPGFVNFDPALVPGLACNTHISCNLATNGRVLVYVTHFGVYRWFVLIMGNV